jgi:hypothetical protein
MFASPVDIAMIAGVVLLIFGTKNQPPWGWKVETNEEPERPKDDSFRKRSLIPLSTMKPTLRCATKIF